MSTKRFFGFLKASVMTMVLVGVFFQGLNLLMIPSVSADGENWWIGSWGYRKLVTVNCSEVAGDLVNFPVLVYRASDSNLSGHAQSDGDDICFILFSDNSTQLNHEIENYTSATGMLIAWVNVTSLSDSVDTRFWMYYGNSGCGSQEDVAGTWDSNYLHVWHMNGGSPEVDSVHGDSGTVTGADIVTGKIGNGRGFVSGNSDYIDFGDMSQPGDGSLTTATFESWLYHNDASTSLVMNKYDTNAPAKRCYIWDVLNTDEKMRLVLYKDDASAYWGYASNTGLDCISKWVHTTVSVNAATETCVFYVNGSSVAVTKIADAGVGPNVFLNSAVSETSGRQRNTGSTQYSTQSLDELRISKVQRSAAWVNTTYNTTAFPLVFHFFGDEEEPSSAGGGVVVVMHGRSGVWYLMLGGVGGVILIVGTVFLIRKRKNES
jgi:hypothetical protein